MTSTEPDRPRARLPLRRVLQFAGTTALGVLLLWLVFRGVDLDEFVASIRGVSPFWWLMMVLSSCAMHLVRVWRWHLIVVRVERTSLRQTLSIGSVGMMAIQAIPLRLGEFVRPYLLTQRCRMSFGGAMYTVVIERTLDLLSLAVMFAVAVFFADIPLQILTLGDWEVSFIQEGQRVIGIALIPFAGCLLAFLLLGERAVRWTVAAVRAVHGRLADQIESFLVSFLEGVRTMRDLRFGVAMVLTSAAAWLLNVAIYWTLAQAFGLELPLMAGVVIMVVFMVGILLPAPPLFAGVFEVFLIAGLLLYNVPHDQGAAYAAVCHVTEICLLFGWGLPFLWLDGMSFRGLLDVARLAKREADDEEPEPPES